MKCNKGCLILARVPSLSSFVNSFLIMHVIEHTFFSSHFLHALTPFVFFAYFLSNFR